MVKFRDGYGITHSAQTQKRAPRGNQPWEALHEHNAHAVRDRILHGNREEIIAFLKQPGKWAKARYSYSTAQRPCCIATSLREFLETQPQLCDRLRDRGIDYHALLNIPHTRQGKPALKHCPPTARAPKPTTDLAFLERVFFASPRHANVPDADHPQFKVPLPQLPTASAPSSARSPTSATHSPSNPSTVGVGPNKNDRSDKKKSPVATKAPSPTGSSGSSISPRSNPNSQHSNDSQRASESMGNQSSESRQSRTHRPGLITTFSGKTTVTQSANKAGSGTDLNSTHNSTRPAGTTSSSSSPTSRAHLTKKNGVRQTNASESKQHPASHAEDVSASLMKPQQSKPNVGQLRLLSTAAATPQLEWKGTKLGKNAFYAFTLNVEQPPARWYAGALVKEPSARKGPVQYRLLLAEHTPRPCRAPNQQEVAELENALRQAFLNKNCDISVVKVERILANIPNSSLTRSNAPTSSSHPHLSNPMSQESGDRQSGVQPPTNDSPTSSSASPISTISVTTSAVDAGRLFAKRMASDLAVSINNEKELQRLLNKPRKAFDHIANNWLKHPDTEWSRISDQPKRQANRPDRSRLTSSVSGSDSSHPAQQATTHVLPKKITQPNHPNPTARTSAGQTGQPTHTPTTRNPLKHAAELPTKAPSSGTRNTQRTDTRSLNTLTSESEMTCRTAILTTQRHLPGCVTLTPTNQGTSYTFNTNNDDMRLRMRETRAAARTLFIFNNGHWLSAAIRRNGEDFEVCAFDTTRKVTHRLNGDTRSVKKPGSTSEALSRQTLESRLQVAFADFLEVPPFQVAVRVTGRPLQSTRTLSNTCGPLSIRMAERFHLQRDTLPLAKRFENGCDGWTKVFHTDQKKRENLEQLLKPMQLAAQSEERRVKAAINLRLAMV